MTPIEFLRALWPATGLYCLATPHQEGGFRHTVVDSIEDAARFAERNADHEDIYFCMHTLKERRRANLEKKHGYEVRTHANMHEAQCFFLDLDVGVEDKRYDTQAEAITALRKFCRVTSLPRPLLSSSGGGVHVFWRLTNRLTSLEWKAYALKLKALAVHHGLKHDPVRVADQSSVLRVAGTLNHKEPAHPRHVKVLAEGVVTPTSEFLSLVDEAVTRAGISVEAITRQTKALVAHDDGLGDNLTRTFNGPAPSIKALLDACPQLMHLAVNPAEQTQPSWYAALGAIRFAEDGRKWAHKFSDAHRKGARTDEKLDQLERGNIGPTLCTRLADVCGEERCLTCPFFKHAKVRSPVTAARFRDEAPAPIVEVTAEASEPQTLRIPVPYPYTRLKSGGISFRKDDDANDPTDTIIYEHDLHPLAIARSDSQVQHMWRVYLPHEEPRDFALDAPTLYDRRSFTTAIANEGIFPSAPNLQSLQDYMTAYVQALQAAAAADIQFAHLGWTDNYDGFILPDKMLTATGARPVRLTPDASTSSITVDKEGTLERQVAAMEFYNRPEYVGHQFVILASLAAPIFFATGHAGVVVNASGEPGASKSTAVYAGASFWGEHEQYTINGTNKGATAMGRQARIEALANLPICVDEITHMPTKEQIDLVMGVTQYAKRVRANRTGGEQKAPKNRKSTIMVCSANSSLHSTLSLDNTAGTAGSMRVVEIVLPKSDDRQKGAADVFLRTLRENYGHIGPAFMEYVMAHFDEVKELVESTVVELDRMVSLQPAERFWTAEAAAAFVAGRIAERLGLLPFNVDAVERWFVETQVPGMRDVVSHEYRTPVSTLAEFLEHIDSNILVLKRTNQTAREMQPLKPLHGELIGRYEVDEHTMWVLRSSFKEYCAHSGASAGFVLKALKESKVVRDSNAKKVLGANCPEYSKAQTYCISIDMSHRDMSGVADLKVVGGTSLQPNLSTTTERRKI